MGVLRPGRNMFWRGNIRGPKQFSKSNSPMANLINELVNEIAWLKKENEDLKRREKHRVNMMLTEKRWRKGHLLESACCSCDTGVNGNWKTTSDLRSGCASGTDHANVAREEVVEGFHGSPSSRVASAPSLLVETTSTASLIETRIELSEESDGRSSADSSEDSAAGSAEDSEEEYEEIYYIEPYFDEETGEELGGGRGRQIKNLW